MRLSIVIERRGNWFVGYVKEIPGVNTQGTTVDEVLDNLKEALHLITEKPLEGGIPEERS